MLMRIASSVLGLAALTGFVGAAHAAPLTGVTNLAVATNVPSVARGCSATVALAAAPRALGVAPRALLPDSAGPEYYAIDLVPTRRVPGTGAAQGSAHVTFARSPFGVAVSAAGSYAQALDIRVSGLRPRADGAFVAWAATADLDQVTRLGVLDVAADGRTDARLGASVEWNKFLVIVSFESMADPTGDRWQGPIVMRGMSRSGMMHTMAGHGPFEMESCIKYGYR